MKKQFLLFSFTLTLLFSNFSFTQSSPTHDKYVVGYFAQWAIYGRDYNVSDIKAENLTHLMYAFYDTQFDESTGLSMIKTLDEYADTGHTEDPGVDHSSELQGNLGAIKILKEQYPHLKVLISLGGWTKSLAFPDLAASQTGRESLADAMVTFINTYPFIDGFDIDWEFPVYGGIDNPKQPNTPDDHRNLVYLLKEMRETFDLEFPEEKKWVTMAGGNNVFTLLSTHVGPGTQSYHGMSESISDYCDFITFFGYDLGGNWYDKTSYNAPLYPSNNSEDPLYRFRLTTPGEGEPGIDENGDGVDDLFDRMNMDRGITPTPPVPQLSLDDLINLYLNYLEIPKEKLILGVPFYGRLFDNVDHGEVEAGLPGLFRSAPRHTSTGCPGGLHSPQGSWDGMICEQSGSIGFSDLSQGVAANPHHYLDLNDFGKVSAAAAAAGWVRYWDDTAKVPYLYNENTKQFVTYDDPESINIKVNYSVDRGLGGVMIWELSEDSRDDFGGTSFGDRGGALLKQINTSLASIEVDFSLTFKDTGGLPISGVEAILYNSSGEEVSTLNSDASGVVTFSNINGYRNYKISYQKSGFEFLPKEKNISAEDSSQNLSFEITGSNNLLSLSGTSNLNGTAGSADIVLFDTSKIELDRISSSSTGVFNFTNVISGLDYFLTAEKEFYSFNTLSFSNLSNSISGLELNGVIDTYTISGKVTKADGQGIEGVIISLTGGKTEQNTTDLNGEYSFTGVEAGKDYTLTPSKTDLNFLPSNTTISALKEDVVANFEQNEGFIYGFVKDGQTPLSGIKVQLVLNWASSTLGYQPLTTTSDSKGMYRFDNQQSGYKISDYSAFPTGGKIEIAAWDSMGHEFKPSIYTMGQIPENPTQFDFNTQQAAPKITINSPSTSVITITPSETVDLEAEIVIDPSDDEVTVQNVTFTIAGETVTPIKNGDIYTYIWTPALADFNKSHNMEVNAEATNNETAMASYEFALECSGTGCPNIKPDIVFVKPASLSINQPTGFQPIPIELEVTDKDGTITQVNLSIDGEIPVTLTNSSGNLYTYNFTPTAYKEYNLTVTATDNANETTTLSKKIQITNSTFVPLPEKVNVGYLHSWESTAAPFLYLREVLETDFNVVVYSFIETEGGDGYTPKLTINDKATDYLTSGQFDKSKLIADIKSIQDEGIPVIVSVGGQNGHVELNTITQKETFVDGTLAILREYGFDGLDIDFEGSSMNFGAGALMDFSYSSVSAFPKLKNVIDAIKEIDSQMGAGFHITAAPEVQYVQQGSTAFVDNWGSFLPVMHNIRDILDYIHVQLYNIGATNGVKGLDGSNYYQGTPDLIVSACESLIQGFTTAGPAIKFEGLRADQVAVGLPATDACSGAGGAAGGGYITPENVTKALNYLVNGVSFGGSYTLVGGPYPDLRGAMTWSINWDKTTACGSEVFEYSNNINAFFGATDSDGDGVNNSDDKCPDTPSGESVDANGCSSSQLGDDDNDGVINADDLCPNTPGGETVNTDGCSESQLDDDNDGVNNVVDMCPNTPSGESVNADGCSDSQLDDDNDGVNNVVDICPNTPSGETVDTDGCSDSQLDDDNDGVINADDLCPNTPSGETVDTDGCSDSQLDDDNDGVINAFDLCPNTPSGKPVNADGCAIFVLPSDNYSIQTIGESCISSNNGKIIVTIKNVFLYTITISNDNTSTSQVFSGYTWTSDDLEAGNYKICFTIDGKPGYEKCFEVQISEPESLSVYSSVNTDTNVLSLSLSGSQNYQVTLNQKTFQTSNQQLEIPIAKGINKLHIKTDKECQGSYTEEIFNSEEVLVYPNPTASEVFIYIGGKDEEATLSIKSIRGRELYQKTHTIAVDRQTSISLGDFEEGIYFISIDGKTTKQKVKIIKK